MGLRTTIRRRIAARLAGRLSRFGSGTSVPAILNAFRQYLLSGIGSTYDDSGYLRDSGAGKGTYRGPRGAHVGQLNGTDLYGSLGSRITTGSPTALTAMCWVKFTGTGSYAMLSEYEATGDQRGWQLFHSGGNIGKVTYIYSSNGTSLSRSYGSTTINDGQWHHVAVAQNGSSFVVYVDGEAETLTAISADAEGTILNTTAPFVVGLSSIASASPPYFPGKLSDCRVYSTAKTSEQIAAIYNDGKSDFDNPDTDGILGGWAIEEESGTTLYDWSGNGNHLTLAGTTTGFRVTDTGKKWSHADSQGYTVAGPNLLTYSEQFDNAAWVKAGATATADATTWSIASGVDKLAETTGGTIHQAYQLFSVTSGQTYTFSLYAQAAERSQLSLRRSSAAAGPAPGIYYFDLSSGLVVGDGGAWSTQIEEVVTGIYRCSVTFTADATGAIDPAVVIYNGGLGSYSGVSGSGLYVWGAQLGVTATPVGYQRTIASAITTSGTIPTVPNTELDAIGGTADFTGLCHYRGRSYTNTLTGNGTNVYVDTGSALIPPTADWDASIWYYHQADETKAIVGQYTDAANPGRWQINTRTSPANSLQFGFGGGAGIVLDSVLQIGSWHLIEFGNNADVDYLRVYRNDVLVNSGTIANAVSFDQANTFLLDRSTAASIKSTGSIANFRITTGGVTKTLVPEGTGTRVWIMGSDGTAVERATAIQGTLTSVHGTAALATEDWFAKYGGRLSSGRYIPAKTDGTGADGITPTSTGGQLLEGRKTDNRGGVDSAFAQWANLESEYTYGDDRLLVDPIYTKDKTIGTGVEYEFKADDDIILDSYAIGGTITEADGYRIHTFTTSGDFVVSGESLDVESVLVGGGGGGGAPGVPMQGFGGGGGGGVLVQAATIAAGTYAIAIGAGGAIGTNGTNTTGIGYVAIGGGAGDGDATTVGSGGSGGGGSSVTTTAGSGTVDQGFNGGAGRGSGVNTERSGGGGGGAGGAGVAGSLSVGGNGGIGKTTWAGTFGGGGGGGGETCGVGVNGGGRGAGSGSVASLTGAANTGGGGGGSKPYLAISGPGAGGSGIVIIRYPI